MAKNKYQMSENVDCQHFQKVQILSISAYHARQM